MGWDCYTGTAGPHTVEKLGALPGARSGPPRVSRGARSAGTGSGLGIIVSEEARATGPKFVFVLMPFAPEFADVYEFRVKGTASHVGAYAERVDEVIPAGVVLSGHGSGVVWR